MWCRQAALVAQPGDTTVRQVMHIDIGAANAGMDQEHVASLALDNVLGAVPVFDGRARFTQTTWCSLQLGTQTWSLHS
jgi:hypothetical protein